MIGKITGVILEKNPPHVVVDVNGVGYEIDVPMSTFYNLSNIGERATFLTHLAIREDAHLLYGFATPQERQAFRALIKVSGIGARIALSVLSGMSVNELAQTISMQEISRLTRIPGIGKKTAERLLLELKGKLGADMAVTSPVTDHTAQDILNALLALGYSEREALMAVKKLPETINVSEGIKLALKSLSHS